MKSLSACCGGLKAKKGEKPAANAGGNRAKNGGRPDVIAIVDQLGKDRVHVVGHDWGAVIAWSVAMQQVHVPTDR